MKDPDLGPQNFAEIKDELRNLMFGDFLGGDSLVTVERSWLEMHDRLPETLSRKRYAT